MRRLPRLRAPGAAALGSAQLCFTHTSLAAPARTTTTATILSASTTTSGLQTTTTTTTTTRHDQRRCLSTTLSRPARARKPPSVLEDPGKPKYEFDQALADLDEQLTTTPAPDVPTRLAYPGEILAAPEPDAVDDPTYKPATTAEGLEEVGGTADWWEQPAHWGTEGGASEFVWSFVGTFGPLDKVTDPAMLEVLVKRAVVEALAVSRFASPGKAKGVDKLFAHSDALDRLRKVVSVEIVPSASGAATLKEYKDFYRVWHVLQSALPKPAKKEGEAGQQEGVQEDAQEAEAPAAEEPAAAQSESATAEQTPEETTTEVVEGVYKPESLTPEEARELIAGWDKGWKKAVLRSPAVKFYAAKRIQQLTGHRIPDGKLVGDVSIATLIAATLTPPKPKKLAQVLQERQAFQGLPNVRVFPRRVTPIDEEIMAGRWKLIVRELEKRKLPVTGTGDFSPAVETRWVAGDA